MISGKIVAIIQGRMSSSRLPGKVLLDLDGKPMLQRVIERVQQSDLIDQVVIATSNDPSDDPIEQYCSMHSIACHRGSLHDVLDRFYTAAIAYNADLIVRVTADCPFIDPELIDETIKLVSRASAENKVDFSANRLPPPFERSYPIGLDVEVCTMKALTIAWRDSVELFHREHVMPYLYEGVELHTLSNGNSSGLSKYGFSVAVLNNSINYGEKRWTVDTPEDLLFARETYNYLQNSLTFKWTDLIRISVEHPELEEINSGVHHKTMTDVDERAKK